MTIIYGIDTEKPFGPHQVREAIIDCFSKAHSEVLEKDIGRLTKEFPPDELTMIKKINVRILIEKYFDEVGGNYAAPTKKSLIAVINKLAEFAKNFRSPKIISQHYGEIMNLIDKMTED